ncbi:MAG: carbohydrate kinase family protein [archaeon]|nr:carbohydrate kinase family protein [archaeon]
MAYDIITVGGANADVFLKTKAETITHENHRDICYRLGEKLLIDKLTLKTGGGGSNTAVAFSRLGLKTAFLGLLGKDIYADMILKELKKEKVDFIGKTKFGNTGYSIILPSHGERTILVFKGLNNELSWKDVPQNKIKAKWFYLSTLLGTGLETIEKLAAHAKKNKIKVAANMSIYLAKQGFKTLSPFLKNIDILILNKEEAIALSHSINIKDAIKKISVYVKTIVITDGFNPALAFDGKKIYTKKIKRINPVEKTGAGDAFAAGFIYGMIKNKPIPICLSYGHKEALSVMKHIGAKDDLLRNL